MSIPLYKVHFLLLASVFPNGLKIYLPPSLTTTPLPLISTMVFLFGFTNRFAVSYKVAAFLSPYFCFNPAYILFRSSPSVNPSFASTTSCGFSLDSRDSDFGFKCSGSASYSV